ncbi:MAG TPA: DUF5615 family PIN-like protein [Vicinamibacterales bacterium]|nr:DUF5615 family PIN-like protein [Vicinamibacterales bacterium]
MKLLVDMNLSPAWVAALGRRGLEAVHWSSIGALTAPDDEVLAWVKQHECVLITSDLDFSAILAATGDGSPSVLQVRTHSLNADATVDLVVNAIQTHRLYIERGVLLSIDESAARVRMLPLNGPAGS